MHAESARRRSAAVSFPIAKQSVVEDFAPKREGISTSEAVGRRQLQTRWFDVLSNLHTPPRGPRCATMRAASSFCFS